MSGKKFLEMSDKEFWDYNRECCSSVIASCVSTIFWTIIKVFIGTIVAVLTLQWLGVI